MLYNPGARSTSAGFQECIDIRGTGDDSIAVRGSWRSLIELSANPPDGGVDPDGGTPDGGPSDGGGGSDGGAPDAGSGGESGGWGCSVHRDGEPLGLAFIALLGALLLRRRRI